MRGEAVSRQPKYHNRKTYVDGICFDSKAEAKRYGELKLLARAGEISNLELQPKFILRGERGGKICSYKADFQYIEKGAFVVEDVKSPATAKERSYRLKAKLFRDNYGFDITEVPA